MMKEGYRGVRSKISRVPFDEWISGDDELNQGRRRVQVEICPKLTALASHPQAMRDLFSVLQHG